MKTLLTAIAMTIAIPAVAQADPGHAGHAAPAAKKAQAKPQPHPAGCHMMNGKLMEMKGGKMVACSKAPAKAKPAADPHAGHNMSKR